MEKFFAGHGRHSFDLFLTLGQVLIRNSLILTGYFLK